MSSVWRKAQIKAEDLGRLYAEGREDRTLMLTAIDPRHRKAAGEAYDARRAEIESEVAAEIVPTCHLYRVIDVGDGYRVYRHCFDESRCTIEEGARAHTMALFVCQDEADDYARYRNRLVDQRGTDEL